MLERCVEGQRLKTAIGSARCCRKRIFATFFLAKNTTFKIRDFVFNIDVTLQGSLFYNLEESYLKRIDLSFCDFNDWGPLELQGALS